MRLIFFGSGSPLSLVVFRAIASRHDVAAVVVPGRKTWRSWLGRDPNPLAREARAPVLHYTKDTGDRLRAFGADLLVVATFPHILPQSVFGAARLGAINVHQSLLPRHRGSDPLFWAYHAGDTETGTTVHWIDDGCDTGDVISQQRVPIARGRSIRNVYFELAHTGAAQTVTAIDAIERGDAPRLPQDHAHATYEPPPLKSEWRVAFDEWPAERTWHFVSGVAELYGRFFKAPSGEPLPMNGARAWRTEAHGHVPGTWERQRDTLVLYGPDGLVEATIPSS
jgi:methionyl-tRNA formyltransferase